MSEQSNERELFKELFKDCGYTLDEKKVDGITRFFDAGVEDDFQVFKAARAPLIARIAELEDQLETERMRLAACSTAALGYFDGAIEKYISQALHDVLALRGKAERWKERAEYEYGLRQYPDNMGLAVGALDVSMLKWQWTGKQAAIDAALKEATNDH